MSLSTDQYVQAQLAELVWQEGRDFSLNVMVAMLLVQANRIRAGWCEGSWLKLVQEQKQQWTWLAQEFRSIRYTTQPDLRDPLFQAVLIETESVYNGGADHLTDGAIWYCPQAAVDNKISGWFVNNILDNPAQHLRTAAIGGMVFYSGGQNAC